MMQNDEYERKDERSFLQELKKQVGNKNHNNI